MPVTLLIAITVEGTDDFEVAQRNLLPALPGTGTYLREDGITVGHVISASAPTT